METGHTGNVGTFRFISTCDTTPHSNGWMDLLYCFLAMKINPCATFLACGGDPTPTFYPVGVFGK